MGILTEHSLIGPQNPNDVISGLKFDLTDPRAIIPYPHKTNSVEGHYNLFFFATTVQERDPQGFHLRRQLDAK